MNRTGNLLAGLSLAGILICGDAMSTPPAAPMQALGPEALAAVKAYYDYDPGIPLEARVV